MFSMIRRRAPALYPVPEVKVRRDPAPTRWHYRYQRMMLTPTYRILVRVGLPILTVALIGSLWYNNDANRTMVTSQIASLRASFEQRPEFMVNTVEITGAQPALELAIADLLDVSLPTSSWALDLDSMRASVTELTAVKSATLRVRLGGTLEIAVIERVPVAVWRYTDGLRLIDSEGVMTGMIPTRGDRADLPLIAGDGAKDRIIEALALFNAAQPIADRVRGLVRMGERRWDMVLDRDQRILLPGQDPVAALQRVIALDEAQDMLARDIAVVDMRIGTRPTIRLNQPAMNVLRNTEQVEPVAGE
ncbi:MAG: cell division protein FtsQ/DivIB [Rhodobacterales bacterium]|nr:cell division protein FtsQ/DivIB [Rhodobacterales bacterium]